MAKFACGGRVLRLTMLLLLVWAVAVPAFAWKSSRLGVSFVPPHGWKQVGKAENEVTFIAPEEEGYRCVIFMKVAELDEAEPEGRLSDELSEKYMAHLQQRFTHFKRIGEADVQINGHWMHRLTFRAQEGDHHMQMTNVLCLKGRRAYSFSYMSKPGSYEKHIKVFDSMLKTVKFL
ncbi:MAG: hypothetical protein ACI38Q_06870 [Candidatus Bruticola sp.]